LKDFIEILGTQLSRKRKNKTTYRVKPSECPISKKYCCIKTNNISKNESVVTFSCPFLVSVGLGNEDGVCLIKCGCINNSVSFIMED
jgi:hypothetical protein